MLSNFANALEISFSGIIGVVSDQNIFDRLAARTGTKNVLVTAVVESIEKQGAPHIVKGVTTNYLLALKQKQHGHPDPDPHGLDYELHFQFKIGIQSTKIWSCPYLLNEQY